MFVDSRSIYYDEEPSSKDRSSGGNHDSQNEFIADRYNAMLLL